jgi:2-C-methyl-D-erythritol 4-phosphate cytidylyltransferase
VNKDKIKITGILAAGGSGKRLGKASGKQLLMVNNKPVFIYSLEKIYPYVDEIIVVIEKDNINKCKKLLEKYKLTKKVKDVVAGGRERVDSVENAFNTVSADTKLVLIHDGARPLVNKKIVQDVIKAGIKYKAAVPAVRVKDTIKIEKNGFVLRTPLRAELWAAQTPQIITRELLTAAFKNKKILKDITDDVSLVEKMNKKVKIIEGDYANIKITTKEDLVYFKNKIKARSARK